MASIQQENTALATTAVFYLFQKQCRISCRIAVSLKQWWAVERQNIATSVHSKETENIRNVMERCDEEAQYKSLELITSVNTVTFTITHV